MSCGLIAWITNTGLTLLLIAIAFLVALKAGAFKNQDRARYLALWAHVPSNKLSSDKRPMDKPGNKETSQGKD